MDTALTRLEIENRLERFLVGKVVTFERIDSTKITGRLQRLAAEIQNGEVVILFQIKQDKLERFEADIRYFAENLIIHGYTSGDSTGCIRGILQGDRPERTTDSV